MVPAVWGPEIANAMLVGERSKRLGLAEIRRFTKLLESLPLVQDVQPIGDHVSHVLPVARAHGLSAYDAAYLELSIRQSVPLATLDGKLERAARKSEVRIFTRETD
jgi:predicted nucleic acid-binding protein